MRLFRQFLEQTPPPSAPPFGPDMAPPGGPMPPIGNVGPLGGGPGGPPLGGMGGPPPIDPLAGGMPGMGNPMPTPQKPFVIKSYDVWSGLENFLKKHTQSLQNQNRKLH